MRFYNNLLPVISKYMIKNKTLLIFIDESEITNISDIEIR